MNLVGTDLQDKLVKKEFRRAKVYASEYIGCNPMSHLFNTRLKRVSELLVDFESGKLLDVGCGPAIIGNTFREVPVEYHGIDISEEMIKECKDTYGHDPQFIFTVGKSEELPFDDSYFDVVICLGAFEYVLDGRAAMKEIKRVLKPQGIFVVTMQNKMSAYRLWQRFIYWKFVNGIHKFSRKMSKTKAEEEGKRFKSTIYNESSFRQLITSFGMEIEDVVYYDFNLFLSPFDNLFPGTSVAVSRNLEFLCRSKLKYLGTGYILKCRNI